MDEPSNVADFLRETKDKSSVKAADSSWTYYPKPKHLYEGTDSEDDETIMREGRAGSSQSAWKPAAAAAPRRRQGRVV